MLSMPDAPCDKGKIHHASEVQLLRKLFNEMKEPHEALAYAIPDKLYGDAVRRDPFLQQLMGMDSHNQKNPGI
eukprot:5067648-Karenia_brevis.AAC.1